MTPLRTHERFVLEMLLGGDHPTLVLLRNQAAQALVSKRQHTGVGEYIDFFVPVDCQLTDPPKIVLDDVEIEVEGVDHAVAVLLFVVDGRINFLEFATVAGEWPRSPTLQRATYLEFVETAPNSYSLRPVPSRHVETVEWAVSGRTNRAAAAPLAPDSSESPALKQ